MLEKIFGKKSTGIIYIICTIFLLLALAGSILHFVLFYPDAEFHPLVVQTVTTVIALTIISAPIFIQKKFRLYIPPFIEISLCAYTFLVFGKSVQHADRLFSADLTPAIGGFVLTMAIFTVVYSVFSRKAEIKNKPNSLPLAIATTVFALFTALVLFALIYYVIETVRQDTSETAAFMTYEAYFFSGGLLFCIVGYLTEKGKGEHFRIRSFKDAESTLELAKKQENKTLYTVVENVSGDTTDYKKALHKAKVQFFFARMIYVVLYGAYVIHTCIVFSRLENWGFVLIAGLLSSFILTACVYFYEYHLFKKNSLNQRLRRLKIAKSVARIYALTLILAAMFFSDYAYKPLSAAFSECMILFNLCLFFYNVFGKPKHYPESAKRVQTPPSAKSASDKQNSSD